MLRARTIAWTSEEAPGGTQHADSEDLVQHVHQQLLVPPTTKEESVSSPRFVEHDDGEAKQMNTAVHALSNPNEVVLRSGFRQTAHQAHDIAFVEEWDIDSRAISPDVLAPKTSMIALDPPKNDSNEEHISQAESARTMDGIILKGTSLPQSSPYAHKDGRVPATKPESLEKIIVPRERGTSGKSSRRRRKRLEESSLSGSRPTLQDAQSQRKILDDKTIDRVKTTVPRTLKREIVTEVYPIMLASIKSYQSFLGHKSALAQAAITRLRELADFLGRTCEY
mmetsp:Transcript_24498/g.40295  ORF Transcript_24498/g.40295 Transcript_24498/m.40295 type:complete len:281 (+) Transcript_24498:277-1119(+)